jgi:hypothetical protein
VGSVSTLLLLHPGQLHGRVLPALQARVPGGDAAAWWPAQLWPARRPDGVPSPGAGSLKLGPDRAFDEETLDAVEAAVLTATVGDGLAFGNSTWLTIDLLDEYEPVLDPAPAAGSRIAALLEELDRNLMHLNHGSGGYGEGLRGAASPAMTADLDDELAAHGSRPVAGPARDISDAMNAVPAEPSTLVESRRTLIALHSMARLARAQGLGLLHGRDLALDAAGTWTAGVFRRHAPK